MSDLEQAQEDIAEINTGNIAQQTILDTLLAKYATGVGTYAVGATSTPIAFPSSGVWRLMGIVPLEQALTGLFVDGLTADGALVNFDATAAAGSFHWSACLVE